MARGSRRTPEGTRDTLVSLTPRPLRSSQLRTVQDLRTFDFEPATRPAQLFSGVTASITANPIPKNSARARARVPYQIAFAAPSETLVCVRRHRRKEVLFAKKKAGKRGQRRPRRSAWSEYKC